MPLNTSATDATPIQRQPDTSIRQSAPIPAENAKTIAIAGMRRHLGLTGSNVFAMPHFVTRCISEGERTREFTIPPASYERAEYQSERLFHNPNFGRRGFRRAAFLQHAVVPNGSVLRLKVKLATGTAFAKLQDRIANLAFETAICNEALP